MKLTYQIEKAFKSALLLGNNAFQRNYATIDSATHERRIKYLKSKYNSCNRPNNYEYLLSKNANIAKTKRASVLVPISFRIDKETNAETTYYTLSKRSEHIRTFRGQVCFMGGAIDKEDKNEAEAAFREAQEEVGIDPKSLTFIAQLPEAITTTGGLVTPIVAYFDDSNYTPVLNKHEVECVFQLPTERFISEKKYEQKLLKNKADEYLMHYFEDEVNGKTYKTWGVTAHIIILASIILHSRLPPFKFDTQLELTMENLPDYPNDYILNKSCRLIDMIAKKKDIPQPISN